MRESGITADHLKAGRTAALAAFRADMEIAERLARSDPSNADWQRDLAVSHHKLAFVARENGNEAGYADGLRKCFAVLDGMKRHGLHFDPQLAQAHQQLLGTFGDGG